MDESGGSGSLAPATEPATRSGGRGRRLVVVVAIAALIAAAAVVIARWRTDDEPEGPSFPDQWDARVQKFVKVVEKKRKLTFKHPVYVDFLTRKEFDNEVTTKESDLDEEDRDEIKQAEAMMRALGFLARKDDLLKLSNDLNSGGILGLYDWSDKRIRIRGTKLTPAVQSTLVHELTHVLQDQYYDLEAVDERHEKEHTESSAGVAWQALIEGDARRIEEAWRKGHKPKQRRALARDERRQSKKADKELKAVPAFLQAMMASSYVFGESLLSMALEMNGKKAIDQLFENPPTEEEHLLDPWTYLADEQKAVTVAKPDLTKGEKELDDGTFGSPTLLFMLAERMDPRVALTAADGWAGDHYVTFTRKRHTCITVDYRGDTVGDVAEMRSALRRWIARGPGGTATVRKKGTGLRFTACDPGKRARKGSGGSGDALSLAVTRTQIAVSGLSEKGVPRRFVRCYADAVAREFTMAELNAPDESDIPGFESRLQRAAGTCR